MKLFWYLIKRKKITIFLKYHYKQDYHWLYKTKILYHVYLLHVNCNFTTLIYFFNSILNNSAINYLELISSTRSLYIAKERIVKSYGSRYICTHLKRKLNLMMNSMKKRDFSIIEEMLMDYSCNIVRERMWYRELFVSLYRSNCQLN